MKGTRTTVRYAKALLDLAEEQGGMEKVYADMHLVNKTCKENRELTSLLQSPIVKIDKKQAIFKSIFSGKVSKLTEDFVLLLASKRRELLLENIAESFVEQYKVKKKILTAVITTSFGLDEPLRKKVLEIVKGSTNSEIELIEKTNDKLIGGFVLQVGDKRVDASLAMQVKKLALAFTENPYLKEF
ncbi:MAG TPA: ATP synthase F1 subunit delta [Bacteroidia bacterium]